MLFLCAAVRLLHFFSSNIATEDVPPTPSRDGKFACSVHGGCKKRLKAVPTARSPRAVGRLHQFCRVRRRHTAGGRRGDGPAVRLLRASRLPRAAAPPSTSANEIGCLPATARCLATSPEVAPNRIPPASRASRPALSPHSASPHLRESLRSSFHHGTT